MYLQSSLRKPNSSILCAWSWDKTQEGFPCCMLKLFTLKAHKTSASLGLMGLELDSGLGAAWCGGWGQRLVTVSSVARTVAMRVLRPKITVLLLLFLYLEAKCHLTFLLATACCSGWWLCFHYLGVQGPVATHLCDSGTPGGVGGWEKWWHVLWFASVLYRVSTELGYVISCHFNYVSGEENEAEMGTSAAFWTLDCQNSLCHINAELAL